MWTSSCDEDDETILDWGLAAPQYYHISFCQLQPYEVVMSPVEVASIEEHAAANGAPYELCLKALWENESESSPASWGVVGEFPKCRRPCPPKNLVFGSGIVFLDLFESPKIETERNPESAKPHIWD